MRKAIITKQYLILCLKNYISEYYTKKITVRGIAAYAGTSTQPIYLNFSSMQKFKEAMVADVFMDIHQSTNSDIDNGDSLYSYWLNYYAFACRNQQLFYAVFLENIGCGDCVQDISYHYFVESISRSDVFSRTSCKDTRTLHDEALIFFIGLILTYPKKVDLMDLPTFMKDTKDYWYRRIIDPKKAYQDIIPQSLIDAGLMMWEEISE